jgi:hypothetical protein
VPELYRRPSADVNNHEKRYLKSARRLRRRYLSDMVLKTPQLKIMQPGLIVYLYEA